jgi:chromosome segregation ATPase
MNILRKLLDVHSLKQQREALEASLQSKNEYVQTLESERTSLQERLKYLVFRYKDVESELAAMNFRLYQLTQANKILMMKLTGTAAQRDALQSGLKRLKEHGHGSDA